MSSEVRRSSRTSAERGETTRSNKQRNARIRERFQQNRLLNRQRVLERFDGYVESVEGDRAFVVLTNREKETLYGEYSAAALKRKGIVEHQRFRVATVLMPHRAGKPSKVKVVFTPVPLRPVTEEFLQSIRDRHDSLFGNDEWHDDY